MHGVSVHHPGHGLFVGAHVGSHDVNLRADEGNHFLGVTAGEAFELGLAEVSGIAGDTAFGAAVGQTGEGAFPTHPHGEGSDLAEGDFRMVTETTLGRTEREVMLDAVAGENLGGAVVAMDGEGDGHGALRIFDAVTVVGRDFEAVSDDIELAAGHVEGWVFIDVHVGGIVF